VVPLAQEGERSKLVVQMEELVMQMEELVMVEHNLEDEEHLEKRYRFFSPHEEL
jgi:hypothetical protein